MILETINLQAGYKQSRNTFNKTGPKANFNAIQGELIAFMGSNGVGKSTFLRTIAQLQKPLSGTIKLFNKNAESYHRYELAQKIAFVSTENVSSNYLTIYEAITLGRYPYTNWMGSLSEEDSAKVDYALNIVKLQDLSNKPLNEVSDGERQKAMIARAIAQDTPLIILDEPTAFLDLQNKYEITHLLADLAHEEKKTIIFSTHDLNIALEEADKIWFFESDKALQAAPEEFIMNQYFDNFFGSKLNFDKKSFSIKRKHQKKGRIQLNSQDKELTFYTQKALERISIAIEDEANSSITIYGNKNSASWRVETKNTSPREFTTLYDLCSFLRNCNDL